MKKLIALILCALLMFSAAAPSAFALGDEPEAGGEPFDVTVPDEAGSVEPEGEPVPTEGEPEADADSVKIFWVDENDAPKSEDEEVGIGEIAHGTEE